MTEVKIYDNSIAKLSAEYLARAIKLDCNGVELDSLQLSLLELKVLNCENCKLNTLQLNLPNLQVLKCILNRLSTLEVANLLRLTSIECLENELVDLSLFNLPSLDSLECDENLLTTLRINLPNLQLLTCSKNRLDKLLLEHCPLLFALNCSYNNLSMLNLAKISFLEELDYSHNKNLRHVSPPLFQKREKKSNSQELDQNSSTNKVEEKQLMFDIPVENFPFSNTLKTNNLKLPNFALNKPIEYKVLSFMDKEINALLSDKNDDDYYKEDNNIYVKNGSAKGATNLLPLKDTIFVPMTLSVVAKKNSPAPSYLIPLPQVYKPAVQSPVVYSNPFKDLTSGPRFFNKPATFQMPLPMSSNSNLPTFQSFGANIPSTESINALDFQFSQVQPNQSEGRSFPLFFRNRDMNATPPKLDNSVFSQSTFSIVNGVPTIENVNNGLPVLFPK
jgi:hypothetical protein